MALDEDLAKLGELLEAHRGRLAEQLADAPASPVRDQLLSATGQLRSDVATVMAGIKDTLLRHQQVEAAALASIEAAKTRMKATAQAYQAALAKKPDSPPPPPQLELDPALHARLRDLLLDEFAPGPGQQHSAPAADPGALWEDVLDMGPEATPRGRSPHRT